MRGFFAALRMTSVCDGEAKRKSHARCVALSIGGDVPCGLRFCVGVGGFAGVLLFELLGDLFALLGAEFFALGSLLAELVLGTEEFDVGHLGGVAFADAGARDAEVATLTRAVARSDDGEEAIDRVRRHHVGEGLAAGVDIAFLAEGDHLLDEGTDGLALSDGGLDAVIDDDRGDEVAEDGAAVARVAAEFEACIAVTHG